MVNPTLYPLTFQPIFKERVWGGRGLEQLYQKTLPPTVPIGESWEVTDRPEGVSVVANGPLNGKDLRWLMEHRTGELLGSVRPQAGRFPLLVKILDAQEKLSLQVHPPAAIAPQLGGEPKTEMWYVAHARPGAELYVGLRRGVTRAEFQRKIKDGSVAECFHRLPVQDGDVMFLPSGRVHAIGAGIVIFEIQQNSDTTYRVFDWNRVGLDGKPRDLHVEQSLRCINFDDFEPALIRGAIEPGAAGNVEWRTLVNDPLFTVSAVRMSGGARYEIRSPGLQIMGVLEGQLSVFADTEAIQLAPGQFCLKPACVERLTVVAGASAQFLHVEPQ